MLEAEINEMVANVLEVLAEERPKLIKIILQKTPFITAILVSDGERSASYSIVDFTSTQEEHKHDLRNYSAELYNRFEGDYRV